jgi:hypothetical protein
MWRYNNYWWVRRDFFVCLKVFLWTVPASIEENNEYLRIADPLVEIWNGFPPNKNQSIVSVYVNLLSQHHFHNLRYTSHVLHKIIMQVILCFNRYAQMWTSVIVMWDGLVQIVPCRTKTPWPLRVLLPLLLLLPAQLVPPGPQKWTREKPPTVCTFVCIQQYISVWFNCMNSNLKQCKLILHYELKSLWSIKDMLMWM